jgi:hypothetical protein
MQKAMNKQELIERGREIVEKHRKEIGHVMSQREMCEYWRMLKDKTFLPIEYNSESSQETNERMIERNILNPLESLLIKSIREICEADLIRERKEKKIDYADHRNIYSIVMSMLFYECFKGKEGEEWPGLSDTDLIKSSLRVVRSLR